jgi:hypothetical protein
VPPTSLTAAAIAAQSQVSTRFSHAVCGIGAALPSLLCRR